MTQCIVKSKSTRTYCSRFKVKFSKGGKQNLTDIIFQGFNNWQLLKKCYLYINCSQKLHAGCSYTQYLYSEPQTPTTTIKDFEPPAPMFNTCIEKHGYFIFGPTALEVLAWQTKWEQMFLAQWTKWEETFGEQTFWEKTF